MPLPQARAFDSVLTGHLCMVTTKLLLPPGVSSVFAGGIFPATIATPTLPHLYKAGSKCIPHVKLVKSGSSKVFMQGIPAATILDSVDKGLIISGSGKVFSA